ncbi:MAG: phage terminase large subunit [Pseudomonadota bacterium]
MNSPEIQALLRTNLRAFTEKVFATINPGTEYLDNWHIGAVTHALERVYDGDTKRLLVTQPPRSLKSVCTSVAFVAWALGKDPKLKLICISYSQDLAMELARQCRLVMESEWYQAVFPGTKLRRTTDAELVTTKGGGRISTSIGGTLTGRGGDILIIDDPLKAEDANSESARQKVIKWYRDSLSTRHNNKKQGRTIITMQRLHEGDLAGWVLERGGYTHLNLPAIAEEDALIEIAPERVHTRQTGEILHPEREGLAELEQVKRDLGSLMFSAQYQQRPVPMDGGTFKRAWFKFYRGQPDAPDGGQIVQSWDTALSNSENADYSVCITAMVVKQRIYFLDVYRGRLEYPDLRRKIIEHAIVWGAKVVLIEEAGAGKALVDQLRREVTLGFPRPIGIKPDGDKNSRAAKASVVIERGDLLLPEDAPWIGDFFNEVLAFPGTRHDDQVDALSQLINWAEWCWSNARRYGGFGTTGIVPAGECIPILI